MTAATAGSSPQAAPRHVLVAVDADMSADVTIAQRLVDTACAWARPLGARLTLCHVALPEASSLGSALPANTEAYRAMSDVLHARNAGAGRALDALKDRAVAAGCSADVLLVTKPGPMAELIVETAQLLDADVVMVATHGRRGLQRLMLGSVAERVAHLSSVPVLLIPPQPAEPVAAP